MIKLELCVSVCGLSCVTFAPRLTPSMCLYAYSLWGDYLIVGYRRLLWRPSLYNCEWNEMQAKFPILENKAITGLNMSWMGSCVSWLSPRRSTALFSSEVARILCLLVKNICAHILQASSLFVAQLFHTYLKMALSSVALRTRMIKTDSANLYWGQREAMIWEAMQ